MSTENLIQKLSLPDEKDLDKYYNFNSGIIPSLRAGKQYNNRIKEIECLDKKGETYSIEVNNRTQLRITRKGGTKQIVYFDTVFIKDNLFYGSKTHFPKTPLKPVPVEEIIKAEFQFKGSQTTKID